MGMAERVLAARIEDAVDDPVALEALRDEVGRATGFSDFERGLLLGRIGEYVGQAEVDDEALTNAAGRPFEGGA